MSLRREKRSLTELTEAQSEKRRVFVPGNWNRNGTLEMNFDWKTAIELSINN